MPNITPDAKKKLDIDSDTDSSSTMSDITLDTKSGPDIKIKPDIKSDKGAANKPGTMDPPPPPPPPRRKLPSSAPSHTKPKPKPDDLLDYGEEVWQELETRYNGDLRLFHGRLLMELGNFTGVEYPLNPMPINPKQIRFDRTKPLGDQLVSLWTDEQIEVLCRYHKAGPKEDRRPRFGDVFVRNMAGRIMERLLANHGKDSEMA